MNSEKNTNQRNVVSEVIHTVGVDEVGRGCLAGPIVGCAFALPPDAHIDGMSDSKKMTDKKRREIYGKLLERYPDNYVVHFIFAEDIDAMGIETCNQRVIERCVEYLCGKVMYFDVVIDGDFSPFSYTRSMVKADAQVPAVMAASIVAKVSRDDYMLDVHKYFDKWGFANHKGYGTKEHLDSLKKYGVMSEHRRSFEPIKSGNFCQVS